MIKRALITGASSGLGKALAELLAKEGISLILTARDANKLEELASALRPITSVICHSADLCIKEERKGLISLIYQHTPDLVINNAGFGLYGDALMHSTEEELQILELNANATLEISLEAARALIKSENKGTIMNISSAAGFFVYPSFCVYSASKAFVTQFSQAFDSEVSSQGVRVLTCCPGQISTHFRERASKYFPQKNDFGAMSVEKAALLIFDQIQKQKPFSIIDLRYKILVFLSKMLPKSLLKTLLKKGISSRYLH